MAGPGVLFQSVLRERGFWHKPSPIGRASSASELEINMGGIPLLILVVSERILAILRSLPGLLLLSPHKQRVYCNHLADGRRSTFARTYKSFSQHHECKHFHNSFYNYLGKMNPWWISFWYRFNRMLADGNPALFFKNKNEKMIHDFLNQKCIISTI